MTTSIRAEHASSVCWVASAELCCKSVNGLVQMKHARELRPQSGRINRIEGDNLPDCDKNTEIQTYNHIGIICKELRSL